MFDGPLFHLARETLAEEYDSECLLAVGSFTLSSSERLLTGGVAHEIWLSLAQSNSGQDSRFKRAALSQILRVNRVREAAVDNKYPSQLNPPVASGTMWSLSMD